MTQPEALRLADLLERLADEGPNWQVLELSAEELRRLHEVNQALLEALKLAEESLGSFISDQGWGQRDMNIFDIVIAAIQKANTQGNV